jgi:hypothetical protein
MMGLGLKQKKMPPTSLSIVPSDQRRTGFLVQNMT